ncbi:uncharacterized protein PITG_00816 [Phytophthora infestans T30-4]|uniref:Uncharacterized protein n=1 Tax=Phytophthora infestans (strain T30-4) TaxID=403677 RepID=D0MRR9_PHYIT|nr:uncharacterized protein PITG_00816 [Phytophthora infestans T30-4]EEY58188.1 conserved hypothetical protein [Phytophthora infestans T30-4]|eukprot:XP_002909374.1 conserved hypothetical protein [Phytophthora infestans T30-4]
MESHDAMSKSLAQALPPQPALTYQNIERLSMTLCTAPANVETSLKAKMQLAIQAAQAELTQINDEQLKSAHQHICHEIHESELRLEKEWQVRLARKSLLWQKIGYVKDSAYGLPDRSHVHRDALQCCTTTLPFDGFSVQLTKAKIGAMSRHRQAILRVPPHLTIKAHRESYLKLAADLLVLEAITPELCYKCSLHTMKFHARAIQMKDMPTIAMSMFCGDSLVRFEVTIVPATVKARSM